MFTAGDVICGEHASKPALMYLACSHLDSFHNRIESVNIEHIEFLKHSARVKWATRTPFLDAYAASGDVAF